MSKEKNPYVCPAEFSDSLDNWFRRLVQDPLKTLKPFIKKGSVILDLGCGPGYFTFALQELTGEEGKVIAADLQEGMLQKVREKISARQSVKNIILHKCESENIGLSEKVDFVLAFWMVHEVPDNVKLFRELKSILNPGGKILIIEPRWHVTQKSFGNMLTVAGNQGFQLSTGPKVFFSRSIILH